jgi:hypothetical protein
LEAHLPLDPWAGSASLLERAVLERLPCAVCLDVDIATILAWRELGVSTPPGRDPISLGTLWAWSGGAHRACRSHCVLNRYLRSFPSTVLGGRWHGMQVEFQSGYGPKAAVDLWNAYFRRTMQAQKTATR